MEYRKLGRSGLDVSVICLGTMMFGGATDEPTSQRIVSRARDAGVNFLDTADQYNEGRSEEVTGRAIRADRNAWIVATKVCNPMGKGRNQRGLSRSWVMQACADLLRRLGTDRIDIYYMHKEDLSTPLEETVMAMGDLVRAGKIRHFGVSNHRAWRIAEIVNICDRLGVGRPVVNQPYYNAMNRMPEVEQLPACNHYGIGIVPYSPMARGVLSGKYDPDAPPPADTRAGRNDPRIMQTEWRPESLRMAREIRAHAEARGLTAGQFATLWVLNNAFVTGTIAGPRTEEQWEDYLGIVGQKLTPEDEALIARLVPIGHSSTPGYNDPAYPIEGRPVRTT